MEAHCNLAQAKIDAARALAGKYVGDVDRKISDLSVSAGERHKNYLTIAKELKQQRNRTAIPFAGGIAGKAAFRRDLHGA